MKARNGSMQAKSAGIPNSVTSGGVFPDLFRANDPFVPLDQPFGSWPFAATPRAISRPLPHTRTRPSPGRTANTRSSSSPSGSVPAAFTKSADPKSPAAASPARNPIVSSSTHAAMPVVSLPSSNMSPAGDAPVILIAVQNVAGISTDGNRFPRIGRVGIGMMCVPYISGTPASERRRSRA